MTTAEEHKALGLLLIAATLTLVFYGFPLVFREDGRAEIVLREVPTGGVYRLYWCGREICYRSIK